MCTVIERYKPSEPSLRTDVDIVFSVSHRVPSPVNGAPRGESAHAALGAIAEIKMLV